MGWIAKRENPEFSAQRFVYEVPDRACALVLVRDVISAYGSLPDMYHLSSHGEWYFIIPINIRLPSFFL